MAIKVISPVNLSEGHLVASNATVLGGQVVKLVAVEGKENHIEAVKGTESLETVVPFGFCYKANVAEPANELYTPFNFKAPLNRQSVILTKGFRAEFFNDGTGAVFAADVHGATVGAPLYINADGLLTTTKGTDGQVGGLIVATVEVAPADAKGVLVAKIEL